MDFYLLLRRVYVMKKVLLANIIIITLCFIQSGAWAAPGDSFLDPILISTPAELDNVRNHLVGFYRLTNDVDLTAYLAPGGAGYAKWGEAGWQAIGENDAFTGGFDGDGHKIIGLWINRTEYSLGRTGLFGVINRGSVSNLGVEIAAAGVNGYSNVGGLAGQLFAAGAGYSCSVTNCYVKGNVWGASTNVGGLVGQMQGNNNGSVSIRDCYATGNVSGSSDVGGLVGYQASTSAGTNNITNSFATGNVVCRFSISCAGGLIGRQISDGVVYTPVTQSSSVNVTNCFATGNVSSDATANEANVGGLVGQIQAEDHYNSINITNCYATGNVSGSLGGAGGLVGLQHAYKFEIYHDFNSNHSSSRITNCYAMGNVASKQYVGGIVGYQLTEDNSTNYIINCHRYINQMANGTIIPVASNDVNGENGVAKTMAELTTKATYTSNDWLFNDSVPVGPWYWEGEGIGFPKLRLGVFTSTIRITMQPSSTTVVEGIISSSLSVSAIVSAGSTLTYQWYSNTSNSNGGGTLVGGATSESFPIPTTLTAAGSPYYYFCEVGAAGATPVRSNAATVTVNAPPVIDIRQHPAYRTFTEGAITGNLTVAASVTGGATLTYQWYSNTSNSNTGGTIIGGETNSSFTIPIALTAEGSPYYYFCEIGAAGAVSVRSLAGIVTVNGPFVAVTNIYGVPTEATLGTPLVLTGVVEPSNATNKTIIWSVVEEGTTGAYISDNSLIAKEIGKAIIRATIVNGLTLTSDYTQEFTITVNGSEPIIKIIDHPANTTLTEGSITGSLSVYASASDGGSLTYQWYSNTSNSNSGGTIIGGATSASFAIPTTLTATGSPYYYFCEVRAAGAVSVRSNAAAVTVNAAEPGGSLGDPIFISTAGQLDNVRLGLNKFYKLSNDIDLTAYLAPGGAGYAKWGATGWNPIGNNITNSADSRFSGGFDGNGHKITGLWVDRNIYTGKHASLFGATHNATFSNLGVVIADAGIKGEDIASGLIGEQFTYYGNSSITNCYVIGDISGGWDVGGLIGYQEANEGGSSITNCYTMGNAAAAGQEAGGLVGIQRSYANSVITITSSYSTSNISGRGYIGGLVGAQSSFTDSNITIIDCHATGNVTSNQPSVFYVGGLVGEQSQKNSIINCYATGDVSADFYVGGLVGNQISANGDRKSVITNCYATGNVSGMRYIGGLVGQQLNGGSITNSYATGNVNGTSYGVGGLVGQQQEASYLLFDRANNVENCYATGSVIGFNDGVGGLMGLAVGNVANSYATGNVAGNRYIGGLVGEQASGDITNCYATGNVSGDNSIGGLLGMQSASSATYSYHGQCQWFILCRRTGG